jgi:hypothetical protein
VGWYAHKGRIFLALDGGVTSKWPPIVAIGAFRLRCRHHARNYLAASPVSIHMRRLRLLTVLVTLLTLPGYGFAGLGHVRSCQAQMQAPDRVVMAGDCCPGKVDQSAPCKRSGDAPGKNGSCTSCKAGYNCKSPQSYEPTHLVAMLVVPARPILTANLPTLVISHSSHGLWRPPRSI